MRTTRMLVVLAVAVLVALSGCQAKPETFGYKSTATIVPAERQETYAVDVRLSELSSSHRKEQEHIISSPRVTCKAGEEAIIQIGDEQLNGVFVTAFVPQRQTGGKAKCPIHVKEKG